MLLIPYLDTHAGRRARFTRIVAFGELVTDVGVEVVEVKKKLKRSVMGKAIIRDVMLQLQHTPTGVREVIIFLKADPAFELICERFKIETWQARTIERG